MLPYQGGMKQIIAFAVAVFLGTLIFLRMWDTTAAPPPVAVQNVEAAPSNAEAGEPAASPFKVTIPRSQDSHFRTRVNVNGAEIDMLVDSGATAVVLTRADAERAGIMVGGESDFTGTARTANGDVRLKPVTLSRVSIGGIERRDVQAAVLDQQDGTSLLGQSFLSKVDHVTIGGDVMTLQ